MKLAIRHQAGEVSEASSGNISSEFLLASLRECTNWWITKEGALERRWGSRFISRTWGDENGSSFPPLLVPFRYGESSYVLEFAGKTGQITRVRVYDENGVLVSPTGVAPDTYTFLMPSAGSGYKNVDYDVDDTINRLSVTVAGDEIYVFCIDKPPVVIKYSGGSFSSSYVTLNGNPYLAGDLDNQGDNHIDSSGGKTSTSSRILFLTGGYLNGVTGQVVGSNVLENIASVNINGGAGSEKYPARQDWVGKHVYIDGGTQEALIEITRIISSDRIIGVTRWENHGVNNIASATLRFWPPLSGTRADIIIQGSVTPIVSGDYGLSYMIDDGAFKVINTVSPNTFVARVISNPLVINAGAATSNSPAAPLFPRSVRRWARPAWGNNISSTYTGAVKTGWPSLSEFWQGRLFAATSYAEPKTIWGSAVQRLSSFAPGPNPDDPIQWEIATEDNAGITALAAGSVLFVGTQTGLYRVSGGPISPENFRAVHSLGYGIAKVKPVLVGPWFAMVRASGKAIMAIRYNDSIGAIEDEDMTRFSQHIFESKVKSLGFSAYGDPRVFASLGNGKIACGSVVDTPVAPSWSTINTKNDPIESMCVMKGVSGDQVWLCVNRSNGRFIEAMADGVWLDSSVDENDVTFTETDTGVTVSGLGHLEGETITVKLDGGEYTGLVVTGGAVTVPVKNHVSYTPFIAGIPYISRIITHRTNVQLRDGTDQMRNKRVVFAYCRVINTVKLQARGFIAGVLGPIRPFVTQRTSTPMDSMRDPYTGDVSVTLDSGYDTDGSFAVETDGPWEAKVSLIVAEVDLQNGQP